MPCYDPPRPEDIAAKEDANRRHIQLVKMEAVLCALTTALGGQHPVWETIDWQKAGVTPAEFELWWEVHCIRDAKRRAPRNRSNHPIPRRTP